MKKTFLIIGVILLIVAVICFILSTLYHWAHGSVLDGSAELYTRLTRRFHVFLYLGIVLIVSGAVALVISWRIR